MEAGKSKRRFKSFKSLFRIPRAGATTGSSQPTELLVDGQPMNGNPVHFFPDPLPTPRISPAQLDDPFGERKRTEKRYIIAVKQLHETLALTGDNWALPPFDAIANYASLLPLREEITRALDVREGKGASDAKTLWSLVKKVIERAFVAVSPFAMNVLQVLKEGSNLSALNPYGLLFSGLLLLVKLADREVERRAETERKIDYISRQLGRLEIITQLPDADFRTDELVNRAVDVLSASLNYIAVNVRYESGRLGTLGNMARSLVNGDEFEPVDVQLRAAVDEFNNTLSQDLNLGTFKMVQEVHYAITRKRTESSSETILPGNIVAYGPDGVVFSVPYERNPHFSGRELLLEALHQKLNETRSKQYNHRIALFGLGGIGKTQLALEYTYRYKEEYKSIFWISAATSANLLVGYAEVAKIQYCSPGSGSPEDIATSALNWFGANENWLLIIDNLDNISVIDGFLPRSKSTGHTLITTRNQNCEGIPAEGFEVVIMTTDESVEFLLTRAKVEVVTPEVRVQAHEIVSELGNLPLAIEQAASYIRVSQNIGDFLDVYRQSRKECLFWIPEGNRTYNYTVGTTWRLSLHKLASISPVSIELIRLLVFLNPDEVMVEFLRIGASALRGELNTVVKDRLRFQKCVFALQNFSLIRVWDSGSKMSIHRLVQTVIKAELDENSRLAIMNDVVKLGLAVYTGTGSLSEIKAGVEVWQKYGPQISSCFEQTNDSRLDKDRHLLGERVADAFSLHGYSVDALRVWTETSNMKERLLGPEHEDTLDSRRHQAMELYCVGQALKAVDLLNEILPLAKRTLGNDGGTTLGIMAALASAYDSQGQYTTALDLYQKIYEISLWKLGHEDSATMTRMEDLARTYNNKGEHLRAADLFQKLVEVQTSQYGPDDCRTLWSMSRLAGVYNNLCLYDKAVDLFETVYARMDAIYLTHTTIVDSLADAYFRKGEDRRAIALREELLGLRTREFGAEHPITLSTMSGLAMLHRSMENHTECLRLCRKTLDSRVRILGAEHPKSLTSMHYVACAYVKIPNYEEALELFLEVSSLRTTVLGEKHPNTLESMYQLADLYIDMAQYDKAMDLHKQVLGLRQTSLGIEHPDTLWSMGKLADGYFDLGQYRSALELAQKTMKIRVRALGEYHPDSVESMIQLGNMYTEVGPFQSGVDLHQQALDICLNRYAPDHPDTLWSAYRLAVALVATGQYRKAITLLEKSLEASRKTLGPNHSATLWNIQRLGSTYIKSRQSMKACSLLEDVVRTRTNLLGAEHRETLEAMVDLADAYESLGQYRKAADLKRECVKSAKNVYGADHVFTARYMCGLAGNLCSQGLSREAANLYLRALDIERTLNPECQNTLRCMHGLAKAYDDMGLSRKAIALHQQTYEIRDRVLGELHPETLSSLSGLARAQISMGECARALVLYKKVLEIASRLWGSDHQDCQMYIAGMAMAYDGLGQSSKAAELYLRGLNICESALEPEHMDMLEVSRGLVWAYLHVGNHASATELLKKILDIAQNSFGDAHIFTLRMLFALSIVQLRQGQDREALATATTTLHHRKEILGLENSDTLDSLELLGIMNLKDNNPKAAAKLFREHSDTRVKVHGADDRRSLTAMQSLAIAYMELGEREEALRIIRRVYEARDKAIGSDHPDTLSSARLLAIVNTESDEHLLRLRDSWKEWMPRIFGPVDVEVGMN